MPSFPCMGLCQGGVSIGDRSAHFFPLSVSLFDLRARFFVPTRASLALARAETVKVGRRTNPFRQAPPLPGHTLTASSTTARLVPIGMTIRGEPAFGRDQSRHH